MLFHLGESITITPSLSCHLFALSVLLFTKLGRLHMHVSASGSDSAPCLLLLMAIFAPPSENSYKNNTTLAQNER